LVVDADVGVGELKDGKFRFVGILSRLESGPSTLRQNERMLRVLSRLFNPAVDFAKNVADPIATLTPPLILGVRKNLLHLAQQILARERLLQIILFLIHAGAQEAAGANDLHIRRALAQLFDQLAPAHLRHH
jgi:hypothetical protein